MGFNLSTTLPSGVVAQYYQIRHVTVYTIQQVVEVHLSLYVSTTTCSAGDYPVQSVLVNLTGAAYTAALGATASGFLTKLYVVLEALPQFSGAVDTGADITVTNV